MALAGERCELLRPDQVVGVEEGEVEIVADAVGGEQLLDHADQRVLATGGLAVADRAVEITEQRHLRRQRHTVDGAPLEVDREAKAADRGKHLRHAVVGDVVRGIEL